MQQKQGVEKARKRTHRPKLSTNLLLALAATLLPIVMIELGMRLYHVYVKIRTPYRHVDNPSIRFMRKPHANREINSLGFRDHEYVMQKPAGVFRIIVLGDSVTNGYGVAFGDMYTKRLESLLNTHDQQYEVISLGMDQYSTVQEVALFKEIGLSMSPDLVILAYVLNDPTPDGSINDFFRQDQAPSLALAWLVRQCKAVLQVRDRINRREGCRFFDYYSDMHCDADKWAAVSASLRELRELSQQYGFQVLLVVFPLLEDGADASFKNYKWGSIHEQVIEEANRNGFSSLDLLPYFAQCQPAELKIKLTDKLHPNKLGNQIAATAIFQALVGLGVASPHGVTARPKP